MSYTYTDLRPELFTEHGVEVLTKVRRNVERLCRTSGAVRAIEAQAGVGGDDWLLRAALAYMVEKGEILEVTTGRVAGQDRVFVAHPNHH